MTYIVPIGVKDGLANEIKTAIREINNLPEGHPIRQRLTRHGRSYVTMSSFGAYALEWLLETLANQEPLLQLDRRKTESETSTET